MTRKTKTTPKKSAITAEAIAVETTEQTGRDVATALLIVSLTINLFVLVSWVTLQVTSAYDAQVASFLFTR
jgi:hypothetical protein